MDKSVALYRGWCWDLVCSLHGDPRILTTTTAKYDQGMARSYQRIPQGESSLHNTSPHFDLVSGVASSLTCPTNILSFQSEKSNPMYGISSEGYSGAGHVQSKSAKAQGISLEAE
jgi:hypothetical protein